MADVLTKALPGPRFQELRKMLGMEEDKKSEEAAVGENTGLRDLGQRTILLASSMPGRLVLGRGPYPWVVSTTGWLGGAAFGKDCVGL
eukprot:10341735-Heterocapsa_arctica.AAC.1